MEIKQEIIIVTKDQDTYIVQRTENGEYYNIEPIITGGEWFMFVCFLGALILLGYVIGKFNN